MLAGATRGTLFTVTGTGEALFARIESELSGYTCSASNRTPRSRRHKPHSVASTCRATARSCDRGGIFSTPVGCSRGAGARSAPGDCGRARLAAAVGQLPLRVASFALQGPERDKVQLLIHADIGTDYPRRRPCRSATSSPTCDGREVDNKGSDVRLRRR